MSTTTGHSCLICASATVSRYFIPHVWHQSPESGRYDVQWCASCNFGYLWPRPTIAQLDSFYGASYFSRYAGEAETYCEAAEREEHSNQFDKLGDRLRVAFAYRMDRSRPLDAVALDRLLP